MLRPVDHQNLESLAWEEAPMLSRSFVRILASAAAAVTMAIAPLAGRASDGVTDSQLEYPAVAGYYEFFVYLPAGESPVVAYAEESCTATLVSSKVMLTASHCTAYNYTEDVGIAGYSSEVWVSFDVTATANDFRCFLAESGVQYAEYLTGEYACDVTRRTVPAPVFRKAAVSGRSNGVAIAHGLTHPAYLRPTLRPDGRAIRAEQNLQNAPDVGALILEQPVTDIVPMPLRAVGELDTIGLVGLSVVSVGYGLNWGKRPGVAPSPGLGPMTDLGGGSGVRRIARLGPVEVVKPNAFWPRQSVSKGDDTVCFGDSGSPLFLVRAGRVEPVISAVLSGATNWCQGSKDPYYRIDQLPAQQFIQCVVAHQDDVAMACRECAAENYFGLCDEPQSP
jgi:hypothetical protein